KGLLFRRGGAAKHAVAMREPAETANNVSMQFRPLQILVVADRSVERNGTLLVGQVFRVSEGQIEEAAQFGRHLAVEAADDGAGGDSARQRAGSKGPRVTAKHIARKLIK